MAYETLIVEIEERVALIRLNRPNALNALNGQVLTEITAALDALERDPDIGALVITGSEKAFAAGADIKEMAHQSFVDMRAVDFFVGWSRLSACRKPTIAAVSGFALGGGCELAMMCDFIIAAENAKFGQPEIKLGVIPAMGGSQRLTRAVGKAKAMDLCLTGRMMDAVEAERAGLVARVVPTEKLLDEALSAARTIAGYSDVANQTCKEAINRAFETTLSEGVLYERRTFHALFATHDQKEGMAAFVEKRSPQFKHR
ncbi:MAG: enoyl-CoA hydratase [Hyphomonadaceae bacterium]|nr:enoyl-CoA hydratase [Hyphomonadaceae bacterium]